MKLQFQFTLTFLLVVLYVPSTQAEEDWGASHNLLVKKRINEDWFMLSRSNLATRHNNEQIFLGYTGVSIGYQVNRKCSVRAGYRMARFRIGENWRTERRPMIESYYGSIHDGWRLTSRSRIEFRQPDWRKNDVRLRQEFTATAPFKFTRLEMQPFVENEIFYSTLNDWVEANWTTAGLSFFPMDNIKVKAGYRHNLIRIQGDFITRHTVVIGVNIFF